MDTGSATGRAPLGLHTQYVSHGCFYKHRRWETFDGIRNGFVVDSSLVALVSPFALSRPSESSLLLSWYFRNTGGVPAGEGGTSGSFGAVASIQAQNFAGLPSATGFEYDWDLTANWKTLVKYYLHAQGIVLCHLPRLNSEAEIDIVTHLALCASQDWKKVDRIVVGNFVTTSQAQRKWYTNVISKSLVTVIKLARYVFFVFESSLFFRVA